MKKERTQLTSVAMETMRPAAPVKLETVESTMYKKVRIFQKIFFPDFKNNSEVPALGFLCFRRYLKVNELHK